LEFVEMNKPLLEIACFNIESALKAAHAGADRIELCDNYYEGGTTPSFGMIQYAIQKINIPINVMIRPRGGDFLYSSAEFEIMKQDILTIKKLGINGIVTGILTSKRTVDLVRMKELIEIAKPLEITFHKAFDLCPDQTTALETLIELGIHRILTSGGEKNAWEGLQKIKELVKQSGDQIIIMPGGGIRHQNIGKLKIQTGAKEYHSAALVKRMANTRTLEFDNLSHPEQYNHPDISVNEQEIKAMQKILSAT